MDQMVREESGGEMLKYWQQNPMPAEEFVIERTGRECCSSSNPTVPRLCPVRPRRRAASAAEA
jgi:hypothetical protein